MHTLMKYAGKWNVINSVNIDGKYQTLIIVSFPETPIGFQKAALAVNYLNGGVGSTEDDVITVNGVLKEGYDFSYPPKV